MPRKIVFINRYFYPDHSATSQLLSDLAFHLAKQNYDVSVISSQQCYDDTTKRLSAREIKYDVNIYRVKTTSFGRTWLPGRVLDYLSYFFGMSWILLKILKTGDIVVVKTDPPLTSIFTILIAKFRRAYHVNWVQDLFPEVVSAVGIKGIPTLFIRVLIYFRNVSFQRSNKTVVIGELMKRKLISQGLREDLIEIIPNWSDSNNIVPMEPESNPLRKSWNLKGKFIVGYSGNMGRVHEFDTFIDAANKLKSHKDILFVFIGGGPLKPYIEKRITHYNLSNILFFPYQPYNKLSESLSVPDIHLISLKSEVEGSCVPSKYYGIIASGRPAFYVGDAGGEISLILNVDKTGIQVDLGDFQNLVDKIKYLYSDASVLEDLSNNARKSFLDKYDKVHAMKKWHSLLQNM